MDDRSLSIRQMLLIGLIFPAIIALLTVGLQRAFEKHEPHPQPQSKASTTPVATTKPAATKTPDKPKRASSGHDARTCPICGSRVRVRHNRTTGEPFLGCSRYPACRGTRPLPPELLATVSKGETQPYPAHRNTEPEAMAAEEPPPTENYVVVGKAACKVGEKATVRFTVSSSRAITTGSMGKCLFLNAKPYRRGVIDPKQLTVIIPTSVIALPGLTGRTIEATGMVEEYKGNKEIKIENKGDIRILPEK